MSTVRAARRWIQTSVSPLGLERRQLIVVGCVCAALFACFFAIGRAASPGGVPREGGLPGFAAKSAGTAVPLRLSSAPAIEPGAPASAIASAAAAGRARSSTHVLAAQAPTTAAPGTRQAGTEVSPTLAPTQPQAIATPTPQQSSAGAEPPAASSKPSTRTGGSSTTKSGGGSTSFDSSG